MMSGLNLALSVAFLVFLVGLVSADMTFHAVAVGQGDSCIIQCPNKKDIVVVDMGSTQPIYVTPDYLTYLLKSRFNAASSGKSIHVVVSHSHVDHFSYIYRAIDDELLPNLREVILGGNYSNYGKYFKDWLEEKVDNVYTVNNQNKCFGNANCTLTPHHTTTAGRPVQPRHKGQSSKVADPWQLCSSSTVKFTVLGANIGNTQNGKSIILKIKYGSWSMLMSGDFEMVTPQAELMENWPASTIQSTYYKVAHHGAWTDKKPNTPSLLEVIQPKKVYISQGHPELSKFHHPNEVTINHLLAVKSIVNISASTNKPFVYWDSDRQDFVTMQGGMGRAIYETCRWYFPGNSSQICQDIVITTDGRSDTTTYVDVPSQYWYKKKLSLSTDRLSQ